MKCYQHQRSTSIWSAHHYGKETLPFLFIKDNHPIYVPNSFCRTCKVVFIIHWCPILALKCFWELISTLKYGLLQKGIHIYFLNCHCEFLISRLVLHYICIHHRTTIFCHILKSIVWKWYFFFPPLITSTSLEALK